MAKVSAALSVDCGIEIAQTSISEIERGERGVRDFELVALAKILEVSAEWSLYGDKDSGNSRYYAVTISGRMDCTFVAPACCTIIIQA